jgi:HPt (histidine-containing phosphotransfer) domain-containing protein
MQMPSLEESIARLKAQNAELFSSEQLNRLQELADSEQPNFVVEALVLFLDDARSRHDRIIELCNSLATSNYEATRTALKAELHHLRGSAVSVGAGLLAKSCANFRRDITTFFSCPLSEPTHSLHSAHCRTHSAFSQLLVLERRRARSLGGSGFGESGCSVPDLPPDPPALVDTVPTHLYASAVQHAYVPDSRPSNDDSSTDAAEPLQLPELKADALC